MASPSGEGHGMTLQYSRLIPEYENLHISGLGQSTRIQDKYRKVNGIPKLFELIYLFSSVSMTYTNSILPEIASFEANMLHHEERANSSPENLPNSTNPMDYNIKAGNDTFIFK